MNKVLDIVEVDSHSHVECIASQPRQGIGNIFICIFWDVLYSQANGETSYISLNENM